MPRVILTVSDGDGDAGLDLEVPADLGAQALAEHLLAALYGSLAAAPTAASAVQLIVFPSRLRPDGQSAVVLQPHQTLAAVGAWDGSWLVLRRRDAGDDGAGLGDP